MSEQEIFDLGSISKNGTSTDNSTICVATMDDVELVQEVEQAAFGVHVIEEEIRQIIEEGKGRVYLASQENVPSAYLVLLFEDFDEERLQPLLRQAKQDGEPVMHDDTHVHKDEQVYFHLLGVLPDSHSKGLGRELLRYVVDNLDSDKAELEKTACVRVNNLASIRAITKELGTSMVSRKRMTARTFDGHSMVGSIESNFNASSKIEPITKVEDVKTRVVWEIGGSRPEADSFLLPMAQGEEDELVGGVLAQIDEVMAFDREPEKGDYVVRGVFRGRELGLDGESYLYFCQVK